MRWGTQIHAAEEFYHLRSGHSGIPPVRKLDAGFRRCDGCHGASMSAATERRDRATQPSYATERASPTMSKTAHAPETPATQALKAAGIAFSTHLYQYEEHGGTRVSARELNVDEHAVVKTLVFEDDQAKPLIVLMHGDCKVSAKELARQAGCKKVEPCKPEVANRHTGYLVGGTSPFGTRKRIPVFIESSITDLPLIYLNGGRRGFLVGVHPHDVLRVLAARPVSVALDK
jgi:Cys-tRNA(Pro) deacylase